MAMTLSLLTQCVSTRLEYWESCLTAPLRIQARRSPCVGICFGVCVLVCVCARVPTQKSVCVLKSVTYIGVVNNTCPCTRYGIHVSFIRISTNEPSQCKGADNHRLYTCSVTRVMRDRHIKSLLSPS